MQTFIQPTKLHSETPSCLIWWPHYRHVPSPICDPRSRYPQAHTAFGHLHPGVPAVAQTRHASSRNSPFLPSYLLCLLIINLPSSTVFSFPSPTSPTGFQVLPILLVSVFPVFISSALGETVIYFPSQWPSKWPIRLFIHPEYGIALTLVVVVVKM